MRIRTVSDRKQLLIDAKNASPLEVGERVEVYERAVGSRNENAERSCTCTIASLEGGIKVHVGTERDRREHTKLYDITEQDIKSRWTRVIGANPFDTSAGNIRPVAFSFDSILFQLDVMGDKSEGKDLYKIDDVEIMNANWNPFVYAKDGTKNYYQRPLVWSERDKQLLVESIYQNIDCGKVLVRKRGWQELRKMKEAGETELSFNDVVDGKQRLNAVKSFMLDEFPDMQGNYYSDLSAMSQHLFTGHQLFSYAEMPEDTKDEDVIKQFLKLNFAGVPQSLEHIEFVRSLLDK